MANARNPKRKGHDTSRDQGGFMAIPWSVLDCPAYASLSHPARSLLWEFARQYVRDNNGRLLASGVHLAKRGWKSSDVIVRAKRELLKAGFIFETVMGHRPNKASWYAVTWRALDKIPGYDHGTEQLFERGAYRKNPACIGAILTPSGGVESAAIAPSGGVESMPPTPSGGAIRATFDHSSTPSHGNHLEIPSDAVCIRDVLATVLPGTPPIFLDGDQPGYFPTQQHSTSVTSDTASNSAATPEVSPTECELVTATDDDGEDF